VNFVHEFNNLMFSCHFLKNFLSCCARSIVFYPPLRNDSIQCALPTHVVFEGSLSLTDSFQNSLKTGINCTKLRVQCSEIVCGEEGGRRENEGEELHGCWGIDAPAATPLLSAVETKPSL